MSDRKVTLSTRRTQQPYGDALYTATVDFHLIESDFGGAPVEAEAIRVVKALWPSAQNVELTARPAAGARTHTNMNRDVQADRWLVTGKVRYAG